MTFKIAITGSIGSGKSTIARMLATLASIPVVDADQIARDVVKPGTEVLKQIVDEFGTNVLQEDKTLNRTALGRLIFSNKENRHKLNDIMFPAITREVAEQFARHDAQGTKYLIYDAPLLYDSGTDKLVDYIILVIASTEVRAKRLKERNNLTKEEIETRFLAQMPITEWLSKPHNYIISNKLSFKKLKTIISAVWDDIKKTNALPKSSYQN